MTRSPPSWTSRTAEAERAQPALRLQAGPDLPLHAARRRAAAGVPHLPARASASGSPSPTRRSASAGDWVGLENFQSILARPRVPQHGVVTRCSTRSVATVGKFALGLWLALLLNDNLPFKSLLRAIILLPFIVPTVLSAIAFWWIYDPQFSIISYLLVERAALARHLYRLPRHAVERALVADRGQHLARHPVRRDHPAGRPADDLAVALRGGAARRRHQPGSASAASPCRC